MNSKIKVKEDQDPAKVKDTKVSLSINQTTDLPIMVTRVTKVREARKGTKRKSSRVIPMVIRGMMVKAIKVNTEARQDNNKEGTTKAHQGNLKDTNRDTRMPLNGRRREAGEVNNNTLDHMLLMDHMSFIQKLQQQ
jgi:hypothetical protein